MTEPRKKPLTVNQAAYQLIGRWEQDRDHGRKLWLVNEINELGAALNRDAATRRANMGEGMTGRPQDNHTREAVREMLLQGKKQPEIRATLHCGAGTVTAVKKEQEAEGKLPLPKVEKPKRKGKKS